MSKEKVEYVLDVTPSDAMAFNEGLYNLINDLKARGGEEWYKKECCFSFS